MRVGWNKFTYSYPRKGTICQISSVESWKKKERKKEIKKLRKKTFACANFRSHKLFFTVHEKEDYAIGRLMLAAHVCTEQLNSSGLGEVSLTFCKPLSIIRHYEMAEI
jgi:hypothetical protein